MTIVTLVSGCGNSYPGHGSRGGGGAGAGALGDSLWQAGAAAASLVIGAVAVTFRANGKGPFAMSGPDERLVLAQTFVAVASVTGLVLAAVTSERRRAEEAEREIAETLQRSLLPDAAPRIAGWEVATLYRPAGAAEVEVGGDFYDFFATPDGWIVIIGDVVGKGVQAAAMAGLVRHGARFVSQAENRPGAILARLDDALREQPSLSLCTALCVGIHTDHVVVSSAGHPPPIVVRLDCRIREIGGGGPILGLSAGASWPERTVMVSPDETVLLYTDGVTDTHGETERFGQQRLAELLIEHSHLSPPELLTELETALDRFQLGRQSDDTAALALRVQRSPVTKGTRAPSAARRVNHGIGIRTPGFHLETVPNGTSVVIMVSGEIDHTTADRVAEAFEGANQDAGAQVVLDLANVTFVDSAGLRALVGIERRARDRARTILIASPPDHVRAVFRLSGLERLLDRSADRGGEWQDFEASERVLLELPVSDTAPRQARAEVREAIAGQLSQAESEIAVLITSELMTNAVVHPQHQAGDSIGLRIATGAGRVRVEVADSGCGFEPAELTPDDDAPGGRGLVIVDRGATRWGTSRNDRFSVWFELTQDRAP